MLSSMARKGPTKPAVASPKTETIRGDEDIAEHLVCRDIEPLPEGDRYVVEGEVARGGMGRVLSARDSRLGREIAIKELLTLSRQARQRFEREIAITARLEHPSILPLYDAGRWRSGEPFYVMRLVGGRPLSEEIDRAEDQASRLVLLPPILAATNAIAFAHRKRIIHRDIKPSNILVGEHGETVVIDWGIAKDLEIGAVDESEEAESSTAQDLGAQANATAFGDVLGTPGYLAPEQARGLDVDERSDVYALGATLFHVLAGQPPFEGTDSAAVLATQLTGPAPSLLLRAPGVPTELAAIVSKAMNTDPVGRYANAEELAVEIQRFLSGQLVAAHQYSASQRIARFCGRHKSLLVLGALALGAIVATIGFAIKRVASERDIAIEAQQREAARADDLLIARAAPLVESDPRAVAELLAQLPRQSRRVADAARLFSEAQARGIPRWRKGPPHPVSLAWHPSREILLAAGSERAELHRGHGKPLLLIESIGTITKALFVRRGETILVASRQPGLNLLNLDGSVKQVIETGQGVVNVEATADGQTIVWLEIDGSIHQLDLDSGLQALRETTGKHASITLSPDGKLLAIGDQQVVLVSGNDRLPLGTASRSFQFARSGERAAFIIGMDTVVELDLRGPTPVERERWTLRRAAFPVYDDAGSLYCSNFEGTVHRLYDGGLAAIVEGDGFPRLAPLSDALIAAYRTKLVLGVGKTLPLPTGSKAVVRTTANSKTIAAIMLDGRIGLWERRLVDPLRARFVGGQWVSYLDASHLLIGDREHWYKFQLDTREVVATTKRLSINSVRSMFGSKLILEGSRGNYSVLDSQTLKRLPLQSGSRPVWHSGPRRLSTVAGRNLHHFFNDGTVDTTPAFTAASDISWVAWARNDVVLSTSTGELIRRPGQKSEARFVLDPPAHAWMFTPTGTLFVSSGSKLFHWPAKQKAPTLFAQMAEPAEALFPSNLGALAIVGRRVIGLEQGMVANSVELPGTFFRRPNIAGNLLVSQTPERNVAITDIALGVHHSYGGQAVAVAVSQVRNEFAILRLDGTLEVHHRPIPADAETLHGAIADALGEHAAPASAAPKPTQAP